LTAIDMVVEHRLADGRPGQTKQRLERSWHSLVLLSRNRDLCDPMWKTVGRYEDSKLLYLRRNGFALRSCLCSTRIGERLCDDSSNDRMEETCSMVFDGETIDWKNVAYV
jgi:hypothetical protein